MKKVYLIGSLRNPNVIKVGEALRTIGFDVMYKFATKVVASLDDLLAALAGSRR